MRLRQIEIFYAVYSTGSISRAAELLGVSQPAVSKILRHTEDVLGFSLFERSSSGLKPTQEATELYSGAARVFGELERFRARIRTVGSTAAQTIRIAFAPSIGLSVGPMAVARFLARHRGAHVEIETLHLDGAITALQSGELDIAVVYEPHPMPGIRTLPLAVGEFVALRPVQISQQTQPGKIALEDLQPDTLIRLNSDAPLGNMLNAHLENRVDVSSPSVTANTYYIAKMLVAQGMGTAIVDEVTARAPPHDGVEVVRFETPLEFGIAAMVREDEALAQRHTDLIDTIGACLQVELSR